MTLAPRSDGALMTGLGAIPAWVAKPVRSFWDQLAAVAPDGAMPAASPRAVRTVEELGCGYYGCVLPTDSRWVLKLTSDPTEAHFVMLAMQHAEATGWWPDGLTRYGGVWALPNVTRYRRPVFALWREAVDGVGEAVGRLLRSRATEDARGYVTDAVDALWRAIGLWGHLSGAFRKRLGRDYTQALTRWAAADRVRDVSWRWVDEVATEAASTFAGRRHAESLRGAEWLAVTWVRLENLAEMMENTYLQSEIGATLSTFMAQQVLVADLHMGNIGAVVTPESMQVLIMDPGNVVVLDPELYELKVPVLGT